MITNIIKELKNTYPNAACSLNYQNPLQLLIAVILSAQATDNMVNKITPALFKKYKTVHDFAEADIAQLEQDIKSSGFYRNKAKNIKLCCQQLVIRHNGNVPKTMDELLQLAGVGRKTANVVLSNAFGINEGIAVDTHVKRVSNRLGLSTQNNPDKIEQDLLKIIAKQYLHDTNHLFIAHGRNICLSRKPKCEICPLNQYCNYAKTNHPTIKP